MSKRTRVRRRTCFVIAPIGEADSDVRRRTDQIVSTIVRPACEELALSAVIAHELPPTSLITSEIVERLRTAHVVVADITGANPNVIYELAIRHVVRKPLVVLMDDKSSPPFDLSGFRALKVEHRNSRGVRRARTQLAQILETCLRRPREIDNPITVALDFMHLSRRSAKWRVLEKVVLEMRSVARRVGAMERALLRACPEALELEVESVTEEQRFDALLDRLRSK